MCLLQSHKSIIGKAFISHTETKTRSWLVRASIACGHTSDTPLNLECYQRNIYSYIAATIILIHTDKNYANTTSVAL